MHEAIKRRISGLYEARHYVALGKDSYGDVEFDLGTTYPCYKSEKVTIVKDRTGQDVASGTQLYLDGYMTVTYDDEFEVEGLRYSIIAYSRFKGLKAGTGTTVIYL